MAKIDLQDGNPGIRFKEQASAPAAPAAGFHQLYYRSDGTWYSQDTTPTETEFGGGGGGALPPDGCYLGASGTIAAPNDFTVDWSQEFYDTSLYFDSVMFGDTIIKIPTGKGGLFYMSLFLNLDNDDADVFKKGQIHIDDGFGPPRKVKAVSRFHRGTDVMHISISVIFPAFEGDEIFCVGQFGDTAASIDWDATVLLQRLAALPIGRGTGTGGGTGTGTGP